MNREQRRSRISPRITGVARALPLAIGLGLLVGCTPATIPSTATPTPTTASSAAPKPTPSPSASDPAEEAAVETANAVFPSVLTFAQGDDLDPGQWSMQWDDHFQVTPGYSIRSADDGNGLWAYLDDSTGCEIWFYQGYGPGENMDPAIDDSAQSDTWLAVMMSIPAADVAANAEDGEIPLWGDDRAIAARTLGGYGNDGSSRVDTVRVIRSLQAVFWYSITCGPDQSAFEEKRRLEQEMVGVTVFHTPS